MVGFDKTGINLGYLHLTMLPVMFWLSYKQCTNKNLFNEVKMPKMPVKYEYRDNRDDHLSEMLEDAVELAGKLPLPTEEFNVETQLKNFGITTDGTHFRSHKFIVKENKRMYIDSHNGYSGKDERIVEFSMEEHRSFIDGYFRFIAEEGPRVYQRQLQKVYSELKKLG
jgi:hypothetical protein